MIYYVFFVGVFLINLVMYPHHQETLFMTSPIVADKYPLILDNLISSRSGKFRGFFPELPFLINDFKPELLLLKEGMGKIKISYKDVMISTHNIFFRITKNDIFHIFNIITFANLHIELLTSSQLKEVNWEVKKEYVLDFINNLTLNQKMFLLEFFFWTDDLILRTRLNLLTERFDPPSINTNISLFSFREHQKKGINFIIDNQKKNILSLLNYDMGAGKTRMILSLINNVKGNVIIILKSSLVQGLIKEARDLNLWVKLRLFIVNNNETLAAYKKGNVIITYEFLSRYKGSFRELIWRNVYDYVITDESQVLQNPLSNVFNNFINISGIRGAFFSGTPLRNGVKDSYYLIYWAKLFTGSYITYNQKMQAKVGNRDMYAMDYNSDFAMSVKRYVSSFTISYINDFKFNISEYNLPVRLREEELIAYKNELEEVYRIVIEIKRGKEVKIKDEERPVYTMMDIIAKIPRMIAIASNFRLRETLFEPNGIAIELIALPTKFKAMLSIIRHHLEENILIFVALKSVGKSYQKMLSQMGYPSYYADGSVDKDIRFKMVSSFNNTTSSKKIFIATRDSMKYGLNFSNTSVVINVDRSWTPADNEQANARIKRLSQKNSEIVIYNIFSVNTIDEYMKNVTHLKSNALKDFWSKKSDYNVSDDFSMRFVSLVQMIEDLQKGVIPQSKKLNVPISIESEDIDYNVLSKFFD